MFNRQDTESMEFYIIGITNNPLAWFPPEVMEVIRRGRIFSGGTRHHELVRHLLPEPHVWIDIAPPLNQVFEAYHRHADQPWGTDRPGKTSRGVSADFLNAKETSRGEPVVVFASGDPLFYGFASTVMRMEPEARVHVFPAFNSLQMLAHRMLLPYEAMRMVSQTGRPWQPLDEALIRGEGLIGVLCDPTKTPGVIARRMLEYGYANYRLTVGERLGNPEQERIREFTLSEAAREASWSHPCCIILQQTEPRPRPFGIPDAAFDLLNGRQNMITKAPLRLLTLSALNLHRRTCMWDIGFCTGSVSIEARLQFPHLRVEAFEVRPEGEQLMRVNSRRLGAPGIGVHIGDFLSQDLGALPRPDAVFIGGHGGRLAEVVERAGRYLLPGGVIVFNSVSQESASLFRQAAGPCEELYVTLEGHHPIRIMKKNYG